MINRQAAYDRLLSRLEPALGVSAFLQADDIAKGDPHRYIQLYEDAAVAVREYVAEVTGDNTLLEGKPKAPMSFLCWLRYLAYRVGFP